MAKNTIVGKAYLNIRGQKVAAAGITPGHLIERTSADKVQVHGTAAGVAQKLFALEDYFQGNAITDAYVADDEVMTWAPVPGERVYAIFDPTSGGTIAIGDFLESAGDGTLRVVAEESGGGIGASVVAVAVEATTIPGGRFMVEIV